ncbi:AsmA family protein [Aquirufa ecclesiirivi]|uniref:AsmA family protein n=1 Tax=Aquirufa ecclesiirivi TaxID=2715124 RepID=A0ABT4JIP9_9BACT|nr:AsmA family protein [Aquirufa ecclesiirivi]MCZ2475838.1 AsmA family protein [Aquirufa ecclesiirivi]
MLKKVLYSFLGIILLFIFAAMGISMMYKNEIKDLITKTANEKLKAKFQFEDASISLLRHFPSLSIEVENSSIIGKNEFKNDTLAQIPKLTIQIAPLAYLLDKNIEIQEVILEQAQFNLIILPSGQMNWDIYQAPPSDSPQEKTDQNMRISLNHYQLIDSKINYIDQMRGFSTQLVQLNHEGSGDFSKDIFTLNTSTEVEKLSFEFLGKTYLSEVKGKLEAPIEMNFAKMEFAFKNNDLYLNELPIHFDAWVAMPDTSIDMDIKFHALKSPLKDFLSLVPLLYQNSFQELQASGDFALSGYAKGKMNGRSMPGFGMDLRISKGSFSYAKVPVGVKQMELDLQIDNPDGVPDHTIINLKKFQLYMNNQPIQANLFLKTPLSNPYLKAGLKGVLNLGEIAKIIPQKNTQMSGTLQSDVQLDGYVQDFKQAKGKANGYFNARQIQYSNSETQQKINIKNAAATINPKSLIISTLEGNVANTEFVASGSLQNYVLYFLKNDKITGNLTLESPLVDLNPWMKSQNSTSASTASSADLQIPKNIDFTFQSSIGKLLFKDLVISQAKGEIHLADQDISMDDLSFQLANASWKSTGTFSKKDHQNASVNWAFNIQDLNIQEAHKYFSLVQKLAPIAAAAQGKVNVDFTYSGELNPDLSPNIMSTNALGNMDLIDFNLKNSTSFNQLVSLTQWDQLKNLALKPTHLNFQIKQGRLQFKPFEVQTNLTKFQVNGSNGLDQSLEYTILTDIPAKTLQSDVAASLNQQLAKLNPNLNLEKIQQALKMQIKVSGTVQKPQFKVNVINAQAVNGNKPLTTQAKELVKQEAKQQINKQLDEAKAKAESMKKEAEMLSQKLRQEAYANADRLVEEAKNPFAKIAAQKIAERLKKEADRKADALLEEADKKAQELIEKARQN